MGGTKKNQELESQARHKTSNNLLEWLAPAANGIGFVYSLFFIRYWIAAELLLFLSFLGSARIPSDLVVLPELAKLFP